MLLRRAGWDEYMGTVLSALGLCQGRAPSQGVRRARACAEPGRAPSQGVRRARACAEPGRAPSQGVRRARRRPEGRAIGDPQITQISQIFLLPLDVGWSLPPLRLSYAITAPGPCVPMPRRFSPGYVPVPQAEALGHRVTFSSSVVPQRGIRNCGAELRLAPN